MQTRSVIKGIGTAVAVAAVGVGAWFFNASAAGSAQLGDCLSGSDADSLQQVECGAPEATFKVVGRIEDQTEAAADANGCLDFATATTTYWEGSSGRRSNSSGTLLCLEPVG